MQKLVKAFDESINKVGVKFAAIKEKLFHANNILGSKNEVLLNDNIEILLKKDIDLTEKLRHEVSNYNINTIKAETEIENAFNVRVTVAGSKSRRKYNRMFKNLQPFLNDNS